MVTGLLRPEPPRSYRRRSGWERYREGWATAATLAALALTGVALLQSPRLPLLALAACLGLLGGIGATSATGYGDGSGRRFLEGAAVVAGGLLVLVGIGHHLSFGLAVAGVLAAASPWSLRWIVGR